MYISFHVHDLISKINGADAVLSKLSYFVTIKMLKSVCYISIM